MLQATVRTQTSMRTNWLGFFVWLLARGEHTSLLVLGFGDIAAQQREKNESFPAISTRCTLQFPACVVSEDEKLLKVVIGLDFPFGCVLSSRRLTVLILYFPNQTGTSTSMYETGFLEKIQSGCRCPSFSLLGLLFPSLRLF